MVRAVYFLCLLIAAPLACSQSPHANSDATAVVAFTLDFPASQPEHYSIRIPAEGPAHYESSGRLSPDSDETDTFDFDFTVSAETRSRIFALAAKAGYFQRNINSRQKNLAFTGEKRLTYKDAHTSGEATYNVTSDPAALELTSFFQNLSSTLEFGHRLDYDRRYQKLALDEELKRMQEMAQSNELAELPAIQPILEQIVADQSVVKVARARAQKLLEPTGR